MDTGFLFSISFTQIVYLYFIYKTILIKQKFLEENLMKENIVVPEKIEDVLKMALEMEDEGYRTYTTGAKSIKNSLGKRMLERLAQDEINHMKRIKEVYEVLEGKKDWASININAEEESVTFQNIFNRLRENLKQSSIL